MFKSRHASKSLCQRTCSQELLYSCAWATRHKEFVLQQNNEFTTPQQEQFWFVYIFFYFWSNISAFSVFPWKGRFLSDRTQQQKGTQRFLWLLSSFNIILWTVAITVSNHSHCLLLCFYLSDAKPKLKEKLTCLTCFILCKRTAYNSLEENTELKKKRKERKGKESSCFYRIIIWKPLYMTLKMSGVAVHCTD